MSETVPGANVRWRCKSCNRVWYGDWVCPFCGVIQLRLKVDKEKLLTKEELVHILDAFCMSKPNTSLYGCAGAILNEQERKLTPKCH